MPNSQAGAAFRRPAIWLFAALVAAAAGFFAYRRMTALPAPGSESYEQATRAFYHGLAALEVGLLDDARDQFTTVTGIVPDEPAGWANLALSHLRLGALDTAAAPMGQALSLAPDNATVVLLAGRMEAARGRLDESIALLRRAADLEDTGIRAHGALAEELERAGGDDNELEALRVLDEVLKRAPDNVSVIVERARIAARRGEFDRVNDSLRRLASFTALWPPIALEQLEGLRRAAAAGNAQDAARASNLLRNVLARVPTFIDTLEAVRTPTELISEPLPAFVELVPPPSTPSPADRSLAYAAQPADAPADGLPLDWNHDFLLDRATIGPGGVRLLLQGPDGTFSDRTPEGPAVDAVAAWAADVEMDGDLDLVAGARIGDPVVLRNNGDGTWRSLSPFPGVAGARGFAWADFDRDADPDAAFIDSTGSLHVFENLQAGNFAKVTGAAAAQALAVAAADLDGDGAFEIVLLRANGTIERLAPPPGAGAGTWSAAPLAAWQVRSGSTPGDYRLIAADLDNNGALDLAASGGSQSRLWLADEAHVLQPLEVQPDAEVRSAVDLNGDGLLDFEAAANGQPVRLMAKAAAGYHWKVIRTRAQQSAGDQRINSYGIGGGLQVRSGLLIQSQLVTGPVVHVGLGDRTSIDVVRIVWPNGVAQAEFGEAVDDELVAEQRLKGSCPWVFAWDGSAMRFVTDFLWRSPLGLRINAQDTAGVVQTEDWVRIGSGQLAAKDGAYDVRITAELWETHFFDHVALLAVDHPQGTEVYVDERFSPASPPTLAVHAFAEPVAVTNARDHAGSDVTSLVRSRDDRYLATLERGRYQGIAREHFVEIDGPPAGASTLVAHGWIYPTDSSINVAIGQGSEVRPSGLSLEALGADGRWTVVNPDLGFPAGKNKTILIDVSGAGAARRLRLKTNLEIYWDALAYARPAAAPQTTRLVLSAAELRYRGFSATVSPRGDAPETPDYARVESRAQRWRDLVGYHTRFGDVSELLSAVDDRYVIMNAGDEMRLRFADIPSPPPGWRRDFVLIGDGWEKDGDYNTEFSQTVLPLPSHGVTDYGASRRGSTVVPELEEDPVYLRHRGDWERYHTRYVTPRAFVRGLR